MSRKALAAVLVVLAGLVASGLQAGVCAPPEIPKFPLPIVMTSPGLSPEIVIVKMLLDKAKIPVKSDPLLEPSVVGDAKTLIIIIGGSGKGLGAAGMEIEDEIDRAKRLLNLAKERKLKVLGIHVGGEARRGENSQRFVELVTPRCSFVVVRSDGNQDHVFDKITQEAKIPLLVIEKTTELTDVFIKMFQ